LRSVSVISAGRHDRDRAQYAQHSLNLPGSADKLGLGDRSEGLWGAKQVT